MDWAQLLTLAVIQGITEFLPISSSAHLILVPYLADWPDQGLGFDLAVHLGTLAAVVLYFRRELRRMMRDSWRSLADRQHVGESRLAWAVIWGTIPVGISGLLLKDAVESTLRSPSVIILTTISFALLLWWADRHPGDRSEHRITWRDWLIIGCAQAIALIPGTSRSGITITAGLLMGLSRDAAARFSFLLAIPVTALAGGLEMFELARAATPVYWSEFLAGAALSGITAFACIHYFLRWLGRFGLLPYVIYRLALGAVLIALTAGTPAT